MIKIVDEYRIVDGYYCMIMESLDWFKSLMIDLRILKYMCEDPFRSLGFQ